jgi:uncharacterized protein DUF3455
MLRSQRRGTGVVIIGMAAVTLVAGVVAYKASSGSSTTASKGDASLMAAATVPRPGPGRPGPPRPGAPAPIGTPLAGGPTEVQPPAGSRYIGTFTVATGTQTYTCASGSFAGKSVPEAQLAGARGRIHHYGGPTWEMVSPRDKSLVTATVTSQSAVTRSIPQLLLTIGTHTGTPTGVLGKAKFIQRLNTSGGAAPTTACTDGEKTSVKYRATYVFWG